MFAMKSDHFFFEMNQEYIVSCIKTLSFTKLLGGQYLFEI